MRDVQPGELINTARVELYQIVDNHLDVKH
jgi:hypothetical protein